MPLQVRGHLCHPPSAVHGAGSSELHFWYAVIATEQHDEELQHLLVVVTRVAVAEQRDPLLQEEDPLASEAGRQLVGSWWLRLALVDGNPPLL